MKIAIVATSFGQTGGPELSAIQLADALVEKGVDVTLFAPGDFQTKAKLVPTLPKGLWAREDFEQQTLQERRNLLISAQMKIILSQNNFDLVHLTSPLYAYAVASHLHVPCTMDLTNKLKERDLALIKSANVFTIAFTEKYREFVKADVAIHLGVPTANIPTSFAKGSGLITVNRITEQKGIPTAIKIALATHKKLTIIGRIGHSAERQKYYSTTIKPFIDGKNVTHIERLPNNEVLTLIAQSEALLFPILRPETFGRVSIEALACGTPVIGTTIDPLPEILPNPRISFLSDDTNELIAAAQNTDQFDRHLCRQFAEDHYDTKKMAEKYSNFFKNVISRSGKVE